jgi:hypothetical protein
MTNSPVRGTIPSSLITRIRPSTSPVPYPNLPPTPRPLPTHLPGGTPPDPIRNDLLQSLTEYITPTS